MRACIENGGMTDRSVTLPPPPITVTPRRGGGALEAGPGQGHWESLQGWSGVPAAMVGLGALATKVG